MVEREKSGLFSGGVVSEWEGGRSFYRNIWAILKSNILNGKNEN